MYLDSKLYFHAGGQGVEAMAHSFFQKGKLGLAGTMAGIVAGRIAQQNRRCVLQPGRALPRRVDLHEMETTEQHIRGKPIHYIQYSLMGAAAEADSLSGFLHQQILFVSKPVRLL